MPWSSGFPFQSPFEVRRSSGCCETTAPRFPYELETGRAVTITGIIVTRFADGKAVDEVEEIDMLGLMRQLGSASAPPNPR